MHASQGPCRAAWAIAALALLITSCQNPESVAKFADESAEAIGKGPAIFADLGDSCFRRHTLDAPLTAAWEPQPPIGDISSCNDLHEQAKALTTESSALQRYFKAMSGLAAFGEPAKKSDSDSASSASSAASSVQTNPSQASTDLSIAAALVNLTGKAILEKQKRSHMVKFLQDADPDVQALTQALQNAIEKQYPQVLTEEQKDTEDHYFAFGKTDARNNPALLYLLNRSYREEMSEIKRRSDAAKAYAQALAKIREGHHALATDTKRVDVKQLEATISAYAADIKSLAAQISKVF
jgi:hypothetical protein